MIEYRLPSLGADMDEGMLVGWLVAPGDTVSRGQVIAEVETDKGIIEVECWEDGVVEELLVQPSKTRLPVGTPLALLRSPVGAVVAPAERPAPVVAGTVPRPAEVPSLGPTPTPPVRHLARELGVDLAQLRPARPGEPISREDIRRAAARRAENRAKATPRARQLAAERGVDLLALAPARQDGLVTGGDVLAAEPAAPVTAEQPVEDRAIAMRRAIARSMARSKREIPHYYVATTIDLRNALGWLEAQNAERTITERLLPAALLLRATALALGDFPELNGHLVDEVFRPCDTVHLGVAVSLREGGLTAPAIHHAEQLTLDELMAALRDLVNRARSWRLRSSEMSDPTITVTNLGDRGVETVFPVIIPPQVAIVGFGRVVDRPWVVDGTIAVHPLVTATLAADHRVSDGHRGGLFLAALDRRLQEPERL